MLKGLFIQYLFDIFVDNLWIKSYLKIKIFGLIFEGLSILKFDVNEIKKNTFSGCCFLFRGFRSSTVSILYPKGKLQV